MDIFYRKTFVAEIVQQMLAGMPTVLIGNLVNTLKNVNEQDEAYLSAKLAELSLVSSTTTTTSLANSDLMSLLLAKSWLPVR